MDCFERAQACMDELLENRRYFHNPKVQFNEAVLPIGAACLAHCAVRWLAEHP